MTYQIDRDDITEPLPYGAPFRDDTGTLHPWSVIRAWSEVELAAIGVTRVVPPVVEPEPLTLEQRKADLADEVRNRRWQTETGGTVVNGVPIRTDVGSQGKIADAIALLERDTALGAVDFEAQPGVWVSLDLSALTAIGIAVGRHVQAAYTRSRALHEAIEAAETLEALDAIDITAGWPPNT